MMDLIPQIQEAWKCAEVIFCVQPVRSLRDIEKTVHDSAQEDPSEALLADTYEELRSSFDETDAGFGPAPKFPIPHHLFFLLRHWKR